MTDEESELTVLSALTPPFLLFSFLDFFSNFEPLVKPEASAGAASTLEVPDSNEVKLFPCLDLMFGLSKVFSG
ncbi:hypothetical protein WICPIJ_007793 [Wickerhamomyces pijperi]|uniref:Uncharacterized protein n=1 Tax=Wickerhamomyces pijperi TaxID=599730 RepID=A0A9P8PZW2_WICPI|nr:hypothetical protein WICPIJ_007793 [Wickerhamomyces pijperi]